MDDRRWDGIYLHWQLANLTTWRAKFRIARTLRRIRSPRRIVATSLAVLFFALYLLNGIFILSARARPIRSGCSCGSPAAW